MKQRTRTQTRLIAAAFGLLLALLGVLLWQGIRRGDAVRVGIPRSPAAMGAAMLLQTPSAQYSCVLGSTEKALQTALAAGELDAALLPWAAAREMPEVEILAAVGYEPLVILGRTEQEPALEDLAGKTLLLDEPLRGSRAEEMLRTLLREEEIGCTVVYEGTGDWIACDLDGAAARLTEDANWHIALSVTKQWKKRMASPPPYGLCLAVRREYLERAGSDFAAFQRALKNAMDYGAEKRKKTVAMAAEAGLVSTEALADALYPSCDFLYQRIE